MSRWSRRYEGPPKSTWELRSQGTKEAEPNSWRTTVTLLGRKAEVESRDPRTMAEPGVGKAKMELERAKRMVELMGWRSPWNPQAEKFAEDPEG